MIYGAKYICAAPILAETASALPSYGSGFNIGALNEVAENLTFSTIKGYGDNRATHIRTDFTGGTVDVKVTDFPLDVRAKLDGAKLTADGQLDYSTGDNAKPHGLAYYISMQEPDTGKTFHEVHFFPKAVSQRQNTTASTVAETATYQYTPLKFEVQRPKYATYEQVFTFDDEAQAVACVDRLLSVRTVHRISAVRSGTADVSPLGVTFVDDNGSFELQIDGTVTALYDNGEDKKASVSEGKYTLSSVTADHELVVIANKA